MNVKWLALPLLLVGFHACSAEAPPAQAPPAQTAPPPAAAPEANIPRVFFLEPQDGATVKSPVRVRFRDIGFNIEPVPAGTVTKARPNMGHFHVGTDVDCLPPATEIPMANPWIHYGDGKTEEMVMQLTPGAHKLTLQVGDDMHRTVGSLCSTITINVVQ
jgi:hypothetical protein